MLTWSEGRRGQVTKEDLGTKDMLRGEITAGLQNVKKKVSKKKKPSIKN